ncbi:MAG: SMP-30/gluconolactonase/LRE family protein, partial [Gemmatimonadales bacterium]
MRTMRLGVALVTLVGVGACDREPARVNAVGGFDTPESVIWDPAQDVYLASNIYGSPKEKDGNGYITRFGPDGAVQGRRFIAGGRNGVTLHAPKGLAVVGDTLWVTDIDVVRAFSASTGAPFTEVAIPGAVFLNDIVAGPDGVLYVTDTGIRFTASGMEHPGPDRVFRIAPDRTVSVALEGDMLGAPNGLAWDSGNGRLIVVSFAGNTLLAWTPGDDAGPSVLATGGGQFDGVAIVDGAIVVSTWADSAIYVYVGDEGTKIIANVPSPADIGYDAKRRRLL